MASEWRVNGGDPIYLLTGMILQVGAGFIQMFFDFLTGRIWDTI